MNNGLIMLAILVVGVWLLRQAKSWKAGLAVGLVSLVLLGIAAGAGS